MIRSLDQMVEKVLSLGKKHTIAVAWAQDLNTIGAIDRSISSGLVEAVMIGNSSEIIETCRRNRIDHNKFSIIDIDDEVMASIA